MNWRSIATVLAIAFVCLQTVDGAAQEQTLQPDLSQIAGGKGWKVVNAEVSTAKEDGRQVAHLKVKGAEVADQSNVGIAWIEGADFGEGSIEVDLKGRDKKQGSFLGIAFSAVDEKTFEAVYFRPFNFKAEDQGARGRSVQYIAWPTYTWKKLRQDTPGRYESAVTPVPEPNGWFHARIEVTRKNVRVFVDHAKEPSLVVERLADREKGRIGLWVDVVEGTFANLKITPAK